jgi:hypothetical protein
MRSNIGAIQLFGVGFIIISVSIAYYFIYHLPQKDHEELEIERRRLEAEEERKTIERSAQYMDEVRLDSCLSEAEMNYEVNWNTACERNNLDNQCRLPTSQAERIEEFRTEAKELCFKKYK